MGLARKFAHHAKWRFHQSFDRWQDRRLGIDASGLHQKDELASPGPNASRSYVYLGTPHLVLNLVFRHLRIDPRAFTFVDLGSGKGRVVIRAATHPFQRVEGVELSPTMHRVSVENVGKARVAGALHSAVAVFQGDVIEYDIPQTPLVVFFFNGFDRVVLGAFLDRLQQSLRDRPRKCFFIYVNPRNGDLVEARGLVRLSMSQLTKAIIRLLSPWPMAIYGSQEGRAAPDMVGEAEKMASQSAGLIPEPSHVAEH